MPIGNSEDISLRALRVLRMVDWIAAENSEISRRQLEHWGITASLIRYGGRTAKHASTRLLPLLLAGQSVAVVCDAGTPGIADPGMALMRAALERNIPVQALPGPAAALVALIASGLPTDRFAFDGFPPRKHTDRQLFFVRLALEPRTVLLYESGAWLRATLDSLRQELGASRRVAVACRLTQPEEQWVRGTLEEVNAHFQRQRPRGGYTLVIEGQRSC